jgi:nitric oxide dioxygenase
VLDVPMDSDLIAAWKAAYMQLAEILIGVEKAKYEQLAAQNGGWAGWREFEISAIEATASGKNITLKAKDATAIAPATTGQMISVRVAVPEQNIRQPQQFTFTTDQIDHYQITVQAEQNASEFSVANTLLQHHNVGDTVEVSAPVTL